MRFNLLRTFFPKTYIRRGRDACKREYDKKLAYINNLSKEERELLWGRRDNDLQEWDEWLQSIKDVELVQNAEKANVYLDEIPLPEYDREDNYAMRNSYYYGSFGERLLDNEVRKQLQQAYRKRLPDYRKERRETIQLWAGIVISILGALTGFMAVYNK